MFETSEEKKGGLRWCLAVGSIAMAAFKVGNPRVFHLFGTEQFEPKKALAFFTDLLGDSNAEWWFMLFLTGGGLRLGEKQTVEEVLTQVGLIEAGKESEQIRDIGQWHEGWGNPFTSRFKEIHEKIEQILQWGRWVWKLIYQL